MPPIDPAVLRARAAALPGKFPDAQAVALRVRRLLEEYADRTHRPSPVVVTSCGAVRGLLDATKYRSACPQLEDTAFLNPATTRTAFI